MPSVHTYFCRDKTAVVGYGTTYPEAFGIEKLKSIVFVRWLELMQICVIDR